jgi:two-component system, chemotaxis family, protein-glutamate methylesterase/glutaminase
MKKIRVLIIEDSQVIRHFLEHIIGSDPRLEVAAAVGSAEEGMESLHQVSPDVISLDIRLPGMSGFEATRKIMNEKPTPIVVCSASVESEDLRITMNALRAGALAVVEKPVGTTHADYQMLAQRLCTQLVIMSDVKVVRQRASANSKSDPKLTKTATPVFRPEALTLPDSRAIRVVGIGASTGGPNAVVRVLTDLGPDFHLPILLVQHMMPTFLDGFVSWLSSVTPFPVAVAKHGEVASPGKVYVAPADRHIELEGLRIVISSKELASLQRPSATTLFASMARTARSQGVGILLTGMGDDGADGLLELRRAGGYTVAEHESTAVVYGMPKAAVDRGAACECLPLEEIGPRVLQRIQLGQEVRNGQFSPGSHS